MGLDTKDIDRGRLFTRRALLVGAVQGGIVGILGARLGWLQLVEGQKYSSLSDKNRINLKLLAPSRGLITDRNGSVLAINEQDFRVLVTPEQTPDLQKTLSDLQKLIQIDQDDINKIVEQTKKRADFIPVEIKNNLSWEDVSKIEVNIPDLPGLSIDTGELRSYPEGAATAHIVGYVGAVSKSDLSSNDPILKLPGFRVGKTGLEKAYDQDLRGRAGTAEMEVNVQGRHIRELKRHVGQQGKRLGLTIDIELQKYAQRRLAKEQSASAVIMDVHTGAVYALVSSPSFDPNLFTKGLSAEQWEELLADPGLPLNNKAIGGQYPPASTFKMISAMAGLEEKIITPNTSVFCPGHFDYGGNRFHCWNRAGHGRVDLVDALAESCDVYFYEMAVKMGIDKLADYARRFGLGSRLDFDLKEERPGLVPTSNWKMGHFGIPWRTGETVVASIGQGYLQATPLQIAVMTARLVNGGYAVKPWIADTLDGRALRDESWPSLGFKQANLKLIKRGMDRAVSHPDGTAHSSRLDSYVRQMGGKTGTAQVRRISAQDRQAGINNADLPWKYRHHALFVGYAPANNPRYACSVVVEHGVSGSSSAAPIARDLLNMAQRYNPAATQAKNKDQDTKVISPIRKPRKSSKPGVSIDDNLTDKGVYNE